MMEEVIFTDIFTKIMMTLFLIGTASFVSAIYLDRYIRSSDKLGAIAKSFYISMIPFAILALIYG